MKCVPSTRNLFHAPCARAQRGPAVVLLLSNTCGMMMKFLLVSKLKRQLCSSVELEVNQSNKLVPGFEATSLKIISLYVCYCVLAQSRGMQALCLAKSLLTAGERLIAGSAVSSQGCVCPLTPGMYVMTRAGCAIHMQHNMHTRHTYCTHTVQWHAKK